MRLHRQILVAFVLVLASCAGPNALGPAKTGDTKALKAALLDDMEHGRLTKSSVKKIASALLSEELLRAQGNEAIQRIEQARACVAHVEKALNERADGSDAAAPIAAMELLQNHLGRPDKWGGATVLH